LFPQGQAILHLTPQAGDHIMLRLFAAIAAIGTILITAASFSAHAATPGWQTYDAASFAAAQASGKTASPP
jgi:hypothetical protein